MDIAIRAHLMSLAEELRIIEEIPTILRMEALPMEELEGLEDSNIRMVMQVRVCMVMEQEAQHSLRVLLMVA